MFQFISLVCCEKKDNSGKRPAHVIVVGRVTCVADLLTAAVLVFRFFESEIRTYEGEDFLDVWYR